MTPQKLISLIVFFFGLFLPVSFSFAGTITSPSKYAWSNNVGWLNFGSVAVNTTALSGYVWSANSGLINLSPSKGGVLNDGNGNLSGFAWGEQLGWIDFDGVSINTTTGKFSGTAVGSLVGTITFDCRYCDVKTDWRPGSSATPTPPPPTGGGGAVFVPPSAPPTTPIQPYIPVNPTIGTKPVPVTPTKKPTTVSTKTTGTKTTTTKPEVKDFVGILYEQLDIPMPQRIPAPDYVETYNTAVTVKEGFRGLVAYDFTQGKMAIVEIPKASVKKSLKVEVSEKASSLEFSTSTITLLGGVVFSVTAKDENGRLVHDFTQPLKITLSVPIFLAKEKNIGVYWNDTKKNDWVRVPDVTFTGTTASFYVSHLTDFAILKIPGKPERISIEIIPEKIANTFRNISLISASFLFLMFFFVQKKRKKKQI